MEQVPSFQLNSGRQEQQRQQNRLTGSGLSPRSPSGQQFDMAPSENPVSSYLGTRVSLISNSEIRYEGTLVDIDTKTFKRLDRRVLLTLQNVRTLGTEGRPRNGPQIPPSPELYDYIVFRGSDIKDLQVLDPVPRLNSFSQYHHSLDDPAILSGGSSYTTLGSVGYNPQYDSYMIGGGGSGYGLTQGHSSFLPQQGIQAQQQQQFPGVFSPFQHGPWGLIPTEPIREATQVDRNLNAPNVFERQTFDTLPATVPKSNHLETESTKSNVGLVGLPTKPRGWGPPPTRGLESRVSDSLTNSQFHFSSQADEKTSNQQATSGRVAVEVPSSGAPAEMLANGTGSTRRPPAPNEQHRQYFDRNYRGRGRYNYRANRGGNSRGRSRSQSNSTRKEVVVEEFDVVAMNEKFEKVHLEEKNITEQELPGATKKYDKQASFFDSLSSSTTELKEEDGKGKVSEMRKLDAETFGQDFLPSHRGGYTGNRRNRGRGRPSYGYTEYNSGHGRQPRTGRIYRVRGTT
eukprot:jgi/Galph1/4824/GphlegSOOS_G3425.1